MVNHCPSLTHPSFVATGIFASIAQPGTVHLCNQGVWITSLDRVLNQNSTQSPIWAVQFPIWAVVVSFVEKKCTMDSLPPPPIFIWVQFSEFHRTLIQSQSLTCQSAPIFDLFQGRKMTSIRPKSQHSVTLNQLVSPMQKLYLLNQVWNFKNAVWIIELSVSSQCYWRFRSTSAIFRKNFPIPQCSFYL